MAIRTFFGSVKLKNEGAVARDHLANERTFLAWLRTSLAFASIGVAVTQFFRLQSETNALMTTLTTTRDGLDAAALPVELQASLHRSKRLIKFSTILGGWFIASGIVVILLGFVRYFSSQYWLQQKQFPVSRVSIGTTFIITLSVSIFSQVKIILLPQVF